MSKGEQSMSFVFERDVLQPLLAEPTIHHHGPEMQIAVARLSMGGPENTVWFEGERGSGKTQWMKVVLGDAAIYEVEQNATTQEMTGYERSSDGESNTGSFGKHLLKQPEDDRRVCLNEARHASAGVFHPMFDGESFKVQGGGIDISTAYMPMAATSNYPDNDRNREFDAATPSRLGYKVIMTPDRIHLTDRDGTNRPGIVPPRSVREQLSERMLTHKPDGSAEDFVNRFLDKLNETGITQPIPIDGRIGQHWVQTIRAKRLAEGKYEPASITAIDAADVAVLGVSAAIMLSNTGSREFVDRLAVDKLQRHEKEVLVRRYAAAVACDLVQTEFLPASRYGGRLSRDEHRGLMLERIESGSFVSTEKTRIAADFDEQIVDMVLKPDTQEVEKKPKRRGRNR